MKDFIITDRMKMCIWGHEPKSQKLKICIWGHEPKSQKLKMYMGTRTNVYGDTNQNHKN